jgi:hypothetical protein
MELTSSALTATLDICQGSGTFPRSMPGGGVWDPIRMLLSPAPAYSGATLAHSQRLLGSFQVARSSYEAVIRDLPGYIMPRLGLAVCLFEMGEVDAAQKEAADALRLVPGFSISRHLAVSGYRKEEHSARRLRAFQALKLVDR